MRADTGVTRGLALSQAKDARIDVETLEPAMDLHARLAHRARNGAHVPGVLRQEQLEGLAAPRILDGERLSDDAAESGG